METSEGNCQGILTRMCEECTLSSKREEMVIEEDLRRVVLISFLAK